MRYLVTRTVSESIEVEGRDPADALDTAMDYGNQHSWSDEERTYFVEEQS